MRSGMVWLAMVACGDPASINVDASTDDAALDAADDALPDAALDAPADALPDAALDAPADAMPDAPAVSPLDPTFGMNGVVDLAGDRAVTGIALRDTGFFITTVESVGAPNYLLRVQAVTDVGAVDESYGTGGSLELGVTTYLAPRIERLVDGSYLVLATVGPGTKVWKLTANGTIDPSFGESGSVLLDLLYPPTSPLVETDDGFLVCGMNALPDLARVIEVRPDGEVASTHDHGGIHTMCAGIERRGDAIYMSLRGRTDGLLARLDQTGAIDETFGSFGFYRDPDFFNFGDLAIAPNGDVIAIVDEPESFHAYLTRIDSAGVARSTFGTNGRAEFTPPGTTRYVRFSEIAATDADRLIVSGSVEISLADGTDARFLAIDATGALDTAWGTNGSVMVSRNHYDYGSKLRLLPDDSVLVGGQSRSLGDTEHAHWIIKIL